MLRVESRAATLALACTVLGIATSARADLIAEEPFVYTAGDAVNGQTGGTGWAGAWVTGQPTYFTASAAIAGAPAIGQTGGAMRVSGSGRIFRIIDTSPGSAAATAGLVASHAAMFFGTVDGIGVSGTTVWVGVLVTGGSGTSGEETQYHFYDGARTDAASLALGDNNKDGEVVAMLRGGSVAQWGFERTCSHSTCSGSTVGGWFATSPSVLFGGTHWSVTRFVFGATATQVTMWRDPTPGTTPPDDTTAIVLTPFGGGTAAQTISVPPMYFNTIAPNASGDYGYAVDEIRITTTFGELSGGVVGAMDAGVPIDAGSAIDAGSTTIDAGSAIDAGSTTIDAGSAIDAGSTTIDAGGTGTDASAPVDAAAADAAARSDASPDGGTTTSAGSGCGCSTPGVAHAPYGSGVLLFGVVVCAARRRRRHGL